jgi:hypothetical protein
MAQLLLAHAPGGFPLALRCCTMIAPGVRLLVGVRWQVVFVWLVCRRPEGLIELLILTDGGDDAWCTERPRENGPLAFLIDSNVFESFERAVRCESGDTYSLVL